MTDLNPDRLGTMVNLFSQALRQLPHTWTLEERAKIALDVLPKEVARELGDAARVLADLADARCEHP